MSRTLINTQTSSWPGAAVVGGSRASCVVCARWCPTLPHPGGCSTIGAVRLSFRVRDGCRAFPCRCDHRDDCVGSARPSSLVRLYSVVRVTAYPHTRMRVWLVVWVGCGPYSGRFAFLSCAHPPPHVVCGVCWGVVVCVGLLVPVSSQTVTGLPLLAYQPSSLLGAYQNTKDVLRRPYLEDGFPLRCFQRLPFPNVANQPCPGRDNWHTRGSSVPVLSY